MKKAILAIVCILMMGIGLMSTAHSTDLTIITGGEKGTYYQFGLNLQQLVNPKGIDLTVLPSNGSVENVYAVFKRPNTQMGIVQSDVLAFVAKVDTNPELKRIAQKIKMVLPLYNEEIHVLGRNGIAGFHDLAGKRVAIGEEGSGTYLTAKLLFEISAIAPAQMVAIGREEALAQLKEGKIDAMFYVAGYPVKLFAEDVTEKDELALVPIEDKNILEFYPQGEIPSGAYNWQRDAVKTAAVKAVLVSYDFKAANCEAIGKFASMLSQNLEWLQTNGHPKWKSVDLNYPLKGWDQYDCVKKYLGKPVAKPDPDSTKLNPVLNAIKDIL